MSVLIDTTIWSIALRRHRKDLNVSERRHFFEWERLLVSGEACVILPVIQETLSGIAGPERFERVRQQFAAVPQIALSAEVAVRAAKFFNACASRGVAAGAIDMTICAAASVANAAIYATDGDFNRYSAAIPIKLHTLPTPRGTKGH
jgi:predicted nucleic acid-binding protein